MKRRKHLTSWSIKNGPIPPPQAPPQAPETCPACAADAPKTRDGRHHPGFNGKRFYTCRAGR